MEPLIAGGHLVEAIIALTVVEGFALAVYHRSTGRGVAPGDCVAYLLSGLFLLVALREALVGASWMWIAAALLGSLVSHLVDLRRRWALSSGQRQPTSPERR